VVEWESEIESNGELFYIESTEENLFENPRNDKDDNSQPKLTRRRSMKAGKLFRLIRRKESKRWSMRNKRINSNTNVTNKTVTQEKMDGSGSKEVTFQDFQVFIYDFHFYYIIYLILDI